MNVEVGRCYRTPFDPAGTVRVLEIEKPTFAGDKPTALVRFVGDHPAGYKNGSIGRYFAEELRELEELPF